MLQRLKIGLSEAIILFFPLFSEFGIKNAVDWYQTKGKIIQPGLLLVKHGLQYEEKSDKEKKNDEYENTAPVMFAVYLFIFPVTKGDYKYKSYHKNGRKYQLSRRKHF